MTRNKKGFTLVELVIVIAVIAILAGVMVAVFSGVVRRANESAELQQVKNDELKQKAEDVLTKLDNANWFSWEDFENSLAAKLTEVYKENAVAAGSSLTTAQVQEAVKAALDDYAKNNASENSQLTEAQVKAIVENAVANAKLGGVTEQQVRTIVNTAVGDINTVSKSDIQKIVDAATAKGLTAEQVAQAINQAGLVTKTQLDDVSTKVQSAVDAINALKPVTKKEVSDAIIDLVPVTYTVNNGDDLADALARVKSFSTLNFTSEYTVPEGGVVITLGADDDRVLTIKGVELSKLTVNAPKATVYLATDAGTVEVTATAENSFHVVKNVETLTIKKGRVVVEDGATVTNLTAAPSTSATVKVVVEENATVTTLIAEYQKNGDETNDWIEVENNGTVANAQLTLTTTPTGEKVTTNVKVTNGANATGTQPAQVEVEADVPSDVVLEVKEEGQSDEDASKIYYVKNEATLDAAVENDEDNITVVFLNNISIADAVMVGKNITLDGNNYTLTSTMKEGRGIRVANSDVSVSIVNMTIEGSKLERAIQVDSNKTGVYLTIDNVIATAKYYTVNFCAGTTVDVTITDTTLNGWGTLNIWSNGVSIISKNSTFNSNNNQSVDPSNTFCAICLESDSTGKTPLHSSDMSLLFENCTIIATTENTNKQALVGFNNGSSTGSINNIVELKNCTLVLGEGNTDVYYDYGTENKLIITSSTKNGAAYSLETQPKYKSAIYDTWEDCLAAIGELDDKYEYVQAYVNGAGKYYFTYVDAE